MLDLFTFAERGTGWQTCYYFSREKKGTGCGLLDRMRAELVPVTLGRLAGMDRAKSVPVAGRLALAVMMRAKSVLTAGFVFDFGTAFVLIVVQRLCCILLILASVVGCRVDPLSYRL